MVEQEPDALWPRIGNPPAVENVAGGAIDAQPNAKLHVPGDALPRGRVRTVGPEPIHFEPNCGRG